jgi:hypothetical protein
MPREKSITHCEDMISTSSSSNNVDNHELLGADQE